MGPVEEPDPPPTRSAREAQSKGAAIFDRTEGIWTGDKSVYSTAPPAARRLGQLWKHTPKRQWGGVFRLIYE